ncbi:MAG: hypothetical protein M3Z08_03360 [Chloroflexota bacterium]|nr:hypothetical protein [Chloroflexota bacterium]
MRALFDNAHAETAGNADWITSTSQPDPLAQNPNDLFGIQFDALNIVNENPSNDTPNGDPVLNGPFGNAQGSIIRNGTTETLNPSDNANVHGIIYRNSFANTGTTGVFVSGSSYGSGRVLAAGDSSAIDDGTCALGNTCYNGWNDPAGQDNILFPNGTEWLAGSSAGSTPTPTDTLPPTNTPAPISTSTPSSSSKLIQNVVLKAAFLQ